MIALQRVRLEIRAPAGGLVAEVHARAGEAVTAGLPLITIVDPMPGGLIAYVPPGEVRRVRIGMPVLLERSTDPGRMIKTRVMSIGATVVELPPQVTAIPRLREWGMPVYLEVTPEMGSIPGESIRVRLLPGGN